MFNSYQYNESNICLKRQVFIATTTKTKQYIEFGKDAESILVEHLSLKHNDSAQKLSCEFGIEFNGNDYPIDDVVEITTLQVTGKGGEFHISSRSKLYAKVWTDANTVSAIFSIIGVCIYKVPINLPPSTKMT